MNFMLLVDYDPDKPMVSEVFGIDPVTFGAFFEKVIERLNKHIEQDRTTDIFFDALNEMPEDKKAGIIMTLAVGQMTDQIMMMSMRRDLGNIMKKLLEDHGKQPE